MVLARIEKSVASGVSGLESVIRKREIGPRDSVGNWLVPRETILSLKSRWTA